MQSVLLSVVSKHKRFTECDIARLTNHKYEYEEGEASFHLKGYLK
jgi:hypothetical protein